MADDLPEFRDWSRVAVLLLRGVVYSEDDRLWNALLSNVSTLENYFARLGLRLVVVESDGMAYLRQLTDDEAVTAATGCEPAITPAESPRSGVQRFFQAVLPARWAEAAKRESMGWHLVCKCGHADSVWARGGIRFGAAGNPRKPLWCPRCQRMGIHTTEWRGPVAVGGAASSMRPPHTPAPRSGR